MLNRHVYSIFRRGVFFQWQVMNIAMLNDVRISVTKIKMSERFRFYDALTNITAVWHTRMGFTHFTFGESN